MVVSGPPTPTVRTELPAAFKQRFDVELEYLGGNTSDLMTRLEAERASGQFTVDAILGGSQTLYTRAYPARLLDPIPPILIHPGATDVTRWTAGRLWFMDRNTVHLAVVQPGRDRGHREHAVRAARRAALLVRPAPAPLPRPDLRLRSGGRRAGRPIAAYLLRMLGEDYVRALYQDQQPGLTRDYR